MQADDDTRFVLTIVVIVFLTFGICYIAYKAAMTQFSEMQAHVSEEFPPPPPIETPTPPAPLQ